MENEVERQRYWGSTASKLQMLKVTGRVVSCTDEIPRTANEIARTVVEIYGGEHGDRSKEGHVPCVSRERSPGGGWFQAV